MSILQQLSETKLTQEEILEVLDLCENAVKIFGPDLHGLEEIAEKVKATLSQIRGVENVGIFRIKGQANLEFAIDRAKCALWNVSVADVQMDCCSHQMEG